MNLIDKRYCYISKLYGELLPFNYIDQYVEIKLKVETNLDELNYFCNVIQFESDDYGQTWFINKDKINGIVINKELNKQNNEFSIKVKRKPHHSYSVKFKFVVFMDDTKEIMVSEDSNIIPIPYLIEWNNESVVYSNYQQISPGFYDLKIGVIEGKKSEYKLPPKQIIWQEYDYQTKDWKDIDNTKLNYVVYVDDNNKMYRGGMWFQHKYNSQMSWLIYGEPFVLINPKKKYNPLHVFIDVLPKAHISPKLCGEIKEYITNNILELRKNKFDDNQYKYLIYRYFYDSMNFDTYVKYYDYANIVTEVAYFKNDYEFIDIYLKPNLESEFITRDKKTNNLSLIIKRQVD